MQAGNVVGEAVVKVTVDSKQVKAGFRGIEDQAEKSGKRAASGFSRGMSGLKKGVNSAVMPAMGALLGLGAGFMSATKAAEESAQAQARLGKALENAGMGAATARVNDYATSVMNSIAVDDEAVRMVQSKIATFHTLASSADQAGGAFDRATMAAFDMAAAGFGSAETNATMLGKALTNFEVSSSGAVKGLTSLRRNGVMFTKEQEAMAAALLASGKTAEYQAFVLAEVEKQTGGIAASTKTASQEMEIAWGEMQESLGEALLPLFKEIVVYVKEFAAWATENKDAVLFWAKAIAIFAGGILALKAAMLIWQAATVAATVVQWAWNVAMSANPIGLIIMAIAALVAGLIWFFTQTEIGQEIFKAFGEVASAAIGWIVDGFKWLWDKVVGFFDWLGQNWPMVLAILTGPMGLAIKWITDNWDLVVEFFTGLPEKIGNAFKTLINILTAPFRMAANAIIGLINTIINAWNGLEFTLPSVDAFGVTIGGFTIGAPDLSNIPEIPALADGGIVRARSGGTLALIGEGGSDEAVVPLDGRNNLGGVVIHPGAIVISGIAGTPAELERSVMNALDKTLNRGSTRLTLEGNY